MPIAPQVGICHHHEPLQSDSILLSSFTFITLSNKLSRLPFWNTHDQEPRLHQYR
jgi:hypothetical protein